MAEDGAAVDLLIVGAGPAGANAALRARACGLTVLLVDENRDAGGQVYRPLPAGFSRRADMPQSAEARAGDALRAALRSAGVDCLFDHKVWNIGADLRTDLIGPGGSTSWRPRALLIATGTTERVVPFTGWTLPGVMGLAAATILLKSQNMLPGRRTVVAGSGPLLLAVAHGIVKAGGEVAAVVDLASRGEWLRALPSLAGRPDLLWQGLHWQARLRLAGVPMLYRHGVRKVESTEDGLRVHIDHVDAEGHPLPGGNSRTIEADSLAVGHGLVPGTDVTRLLRARHRYARERGGWIAETDVEGRTSVPGLYLAGDGAGIAGAAAAGAHGELAALACAADLGRIGSETHLRERASLLAAWSRPARFGRAMAGLMALRDGAVAAIAADTVVCRCEDVTRAEIDAAATEGARDLNQLKAWTRCGMGPCQGRTCGDVAGALLALHGGSRESVGCFTGRAPLRPVSLAEVAGDYTYADIPIPKAAPPVNPIANAYDAVVIGGGVMGCSTALHLAQGGMRVAVIDRGPLCREASGVNAGTLTLHMTRAALVPYAMRAWRMWMEAEQWLGMGVLAMHVPGLTLAFTEGECELVELRAKARRDYGAPIEVISPERARQIEPGVHPALLKAGYCEIDGFASAYLTGRAFRHALARAGVDVLENRPVQAIDSTDAGHTVRFDGPEGASVLHTRRVVLAGGVWIENMLGWLGVQIPIKVLINQLIVTERIRPVMRTVLSVANGLLSLKQFANGTVLIGGGWQGEGDRLRGGVEARPQNLVGNMRLAAYAVPALAEARVARIWLGLEAETADAMPIVGDVPGVPGAYVVGSAHSGYTSGPFMGRILAQHMLGQQPDLPLFEPARLLGMPMPGA